MRHMLKKLSVLAGVVLLSQTPISKGNTSDWPLSLDELCRMTQKCTSDEFQSTEHGLYHYAYKIDALYLEGDPLEVNEKMGAINKVLDNSLSLDELSDKLPSYHFIRLESERPENTINLANFNTHSGFTPLSDINTYYGLNTLSVETVLNSNVSSAKHDTASYSDIASPKPHTATNMAHIVQFLPSVNGYTETRRFFSTNNKYVGFGVLNGVSFTINHCETCDKVSFVINEYHVGRKTAPNKKGVQATLYGIYKDTGEQVLGDDIINVIETPYHTSQHGMYVLFVTREKQETTNQTY